MEDVYSVAGGVFFSLNDIAPGRPVSAKPRGHRDASLPTVLSILMGDKFTEEARAVLGVYIQLDDYERTRPG